MLGNYLTIVLAPLVAAIVAGLFGKQIGRAGAHWITIVAVGLSFVLSALVLKAMVFDGAPSENISLYTWAVSDGLRMEVGFLIDTLSAIADNSAGISSTATGSADQIAAVIGTR